MRRLCRCNLCPNGLGRSGCRGRFWLRDRLVVQLDSAVRVGLENSDSIYIVLSGGGERQFDRGDIFAYHRTRIITAEAEFRSYCIDNNPVVLAQVGAEYQLVTALDIFADERTEIGNHDTLIICQQLLK